MAGKDSQQSKTKVTEITKATTPKPTGGTKDISTDTTIDPEIRIDKIYRRKVIRGGKTIEALSWVTADGQHHGFKETKIKNEDGAVVGSVKEFPIDYNEGLGKKLLEQAEKTNPEFKMTFKQGGLTIAVQEVDNFIGDFKTLMKQARQGQVI
jgi:sporulation protein YlmC with PRC-barrel domain